ncbi:MAG: hypothetical protein ACRCS9_13115 [Hyphomicrobium sp.]
MKHTFRGWTGAAVAALIAFTSVSAEARQRRSSDDGDYVVAESRHGNGTVSGAVRGSSLGPQVQLPSGRWEYCRRSCSETLRVETVDFFEDQGRRVGWGTFANECGVFGCLELRYPR